MTNYEGYGYYEIPADPARYGKTTNEELQQLVANYLVPLAGKTETSRSNDPLEPTAIETVILINAVSVGVGFSVLALSQFRVIAQFGGLIALSMAVSAVVSLTVIPVLLTTVRPKFIYGQNSHNNTYPKENEK
jgi:hypothetical protein